MVQNFGFILQSGKLLTWSKNSRSLLNLKELYYIYKSPSLHSVLSQLDGVHTGTLHFLWYILIVSSHLCLSFQNDRQLWGFLMKILYMPYVSPVCRACYVSHPPHPSWFAYCVLLNVDCNNTTLHDKNVTDVCSKSVMYTREVREPDEYWITMITRRQTLCRKKAIRVATHSFKRINSLRNRS